MNHGIKYNLLLFNINKIKIIIKKKFTILSPDKHFELFAQINAVKSLTIQHAIKLLKSLKIITDL